MKKVLSLVAVAAMFMFSSCSDDKDDLPTKESLTGSNSVVLKFDNGVLGKKLQLNEAYTNSNEELIKITALDYIVGNFVLTNENGSEVKVDGFYIISEGGETFGGVKKEANSQVILSKIPAGKYTKIKFGIGVDKKTFEAQTEKFNADGDSKGIDLWTQAKKYGLVWNWTSGYKFVQYEGTFGNPEEGFAVHIASKGTDDMYREVELPVETALVSNDISPQLHIKVDVDKILVGTSKIKLSDGGTIMGGDRAKLITENITKMFMVHHVHNGGHHE